MVSHKETESGGLGCLTTATLLIQGVVVEMCVSLCEYTKGEHVTLGSHSGQRLITDPKEVISSLFVTI